MIIEGNTRTVLDRASRFSNGGGRSRAEIDSSTTESLPGGFSVVF